MEYEVFQRSDNDWVAHIKGHIELWECGATEEEAVEKLRVTRGNIATEQPEGTCACGKKPQEHLSKDILTQHHYWYSHRGHVVGCRVCELESES